MREIPENASSSVDPQYLVVVRKRDGTLIKGTLEWPVYSEEPQLLPALPAVVQVKTEPTAICTVAIQDTKAVFFVKTLAGNPQHEEVKFFHQGVPSNLWIQVRTFDGEVLQGRTANTLNLLNEPGFWLWPTDEFANNRLVYVPKSSAVEFRILGLEVAVSHLSPDPFVEEIGADAW